MSKNEYKCNEKLYLRLDEILFPKGKINNNTTPEWVRAVRERFRTLRSGAELFSDVNWFHKSNLATEAMFMRYVDLFLPHGRYHGAFQALSSYCDIPDEWQVIAVAFQNINKAAATDAFLALALCSAYVVWNMIRDEKTENIANLERLEIVIQHTLANIEQPQSPGFHNVLSSNTLAGKFRDFFSVRSFVNFAVPTVRCTDRDEALAQIRRAQAKWLATSAPSDSPMRQHVPSRNSGGSAALRQLQDMSPFMPGSAEPTQVNDMDWRTQTRRQQRKPTKKPKKPSATKKKKPAKKPSVVKRKPQH